MTKQDKLMLGGQDIQHASGPFITSLWYADGYHRHILGLHVLSVQVGGSQNETS